MKTGIFITMAPSQQGIFAGSGPQQGSNGGGQFAALLAEIVGSLPQFTLSGDSKGGDKLGGSSPTNTTGANGETPNELEWEGFQPFLSWLELVEPTRSGCLQAQEGLEEAFPGFELTGENLLQYLGQEATPALLLQQWEGLGPAGQEIASAILYGWITAAFSGPLSERAAWENAGPGFKLTRENFPQYLGQELAPVSPFQGRCEPGYAGQGMVSTILKTGDKLKLTGEGLGLTGNELELTGNELKLMGNGLGLTGNELELTGNEPELTEKIALQFLQPSKIKMSREQLPEGAFSLQENPLPGFSFLDSEKGDIPGNLFSRLEDFFRALLFWKAKGANEEPVNLGQGQGFFLRQGKGLWPEHGNQDLSSTSGDELLLPLQGPTGEVFSKAAAILNTGTGNLLQEAFAQVLERINLLSRSGEQELRVKLEPENLGEVLIRMRRAKGVLSAEIITQNLAVKELLEGNLDALRQRFQQLNLRVEEFNVYLEGEGHSGSEFAGEDRSRSPRLVFETGGRLDKSGEKELYFPKALPKGKVDCLV